MRFFLKYILGSTKMPPFEYLLDFLRGLFHNTFFFEIYPINPSEIPLEVFFFSEVLSGVPSRYLQKVPSNIVLENYRDPSKSFF